MMANKNETNKLSKTLKTASPRLQSLRLPRDLSLGGNKPLKKIYKPNVNVVRNKSKVKDASKKIEKRLQKQPKPVESYKPKLIQTPSVFSEGIREQFRPLSKKIVTRDRPIVPNFEPSTVKESQSKIEKKKKKPVPNKIEEDVYKDLLHFEDDSSDLDEKTAFQPIEYIEKDKCESDCKLETGQNCLPWDYSDYQSSLRNQPALSLWQLPDSFPFKNKSNTKLKGKPADCKLKDLPEGRIGKILVKKSGKTEVWIGDVKYDLESLENQTNKSELVALILKNLGNGGTAAHLGDVYSEFQLIPDWTNLIC